MQRNHWQIPQVQKLEGVCIPYHNSYPECEPSKITRRNADESTVSPPLMYVDTIMPDFIFDQDRSMIATKTVGSMSLDQFFRTS